MWSIQACIYRGYENISPLHYIPSRPGGAGPWPLPFEAQMAYPGAQLAYDHCPSRCHLQACLGSLAPSRALNPLSPKAWRGSWLPLCGMSHCTATSQNPRMRWAMDSKVAPAKALRLRWYNRKASCPRFTLLFLLSSHRRTFNPWFWCWLSE